MKRELTCVNCPKGCLITVEVENGQVVSLTGNSCARGDAYARQEILDPQRMVTGLVRIAGCATPLSVKTSAPIPKARIADCLESIRHAMPQLPVRIGDTVVRNVLGLGVDVVATRELA